jgi:hypothetical protein
MHILTQPPSLKVSEGIGSSPMFRQRGGESQTDADNVCLERSSRGASALPINRE